MIGIGGSSMSGLAEMLLDQGYHVTGSDRDETYLVHFAREKGAEVMIGHKAENVHGADLVVYSAAIAADNPERKEAERLGIPAIERAWLLGQLMEGFPEAVGICGAHCKTTVTSMLSQVLLEAGKDPSIHIGGRLDAIGGSTIVGDAPYEEWASKNNINIDNDINITIEKEIPSIFGKIIGKDKYFSFTF